MKRYLLILFLCADILSLAAQEKRPKVHLETTDPNGVKKEFDAKCFVLNLIKSNNTFAVILFDKGLIADSKEIKVYLNQQQKADALIITIPVNSQNVVQSGRLAGIPYLTIREQTKNLSVVPPIFFPGDIIPEVIKNVTQKDIGDFILEMEKWVEN